MARLLEGLVQDLMHKAISKSNYTRIFYHGSMNLALARKAFDIVKRREALNNDFFEPYLTFLAYSGLPDEVSQGIAEANKVKVQPPPDKWHSVLATANAYKGDLVKALANITAARNLGVYDGRAHDVVVRTLCKQARNRTVRYNNERKLVGAEPSEVDPFARAEDNELINELIAQALTLARSLRERGLVLHDKTFYLLVHTLVTLGRFLEAHEMAEWAWQLGHHDVPIAETRFLAAVTRRHTKEAVELMAALPRQKHIHYSVLFSRCGKHEDLQLWLPLIVQALRNYPNGSVRLYNTILDMLGSRQALKEMDNVFDLLRQSKLAPLSRSYMLAVKAHLENGNIERALQYVREMQTRSFHVDKHMRYTYGIMLSKLGNNGMWEQCDELLSYWKDNGLVNYFDTDDPLVVFLPKMFPYWAQHKEKYTHAIAHILLLVPWDRLIKMNLFLGKLSSNGDLMACINAVRVMRSYNIIPDQWTYSSLFIAATKANLSSGHELLFQGMASDGVDPNLSLKLQFVILRYFIAANNAKECEPILAEVYRMYDRIPATFSKAQVNELSELAAQVNKLTGSRGGESGMDGLNNAVT